MSALLPKADIVSKERELCARLIIAVGPEEPGGAFMNRIIGLLVMFTLPL